MTLLLFGLFVAMSVAASLLDRKGMFLLSGWARLLAPLPLMTTNALLALVCVQLGLLLWAYDEEQYYLSNRRQK